MCEANVYLIDKNNIEHEVMREVDAISVVNDHLRMVDFTGKYKELRGKVVFIDFDQHKVVVEELP